MRWLILAALGNIALGVFANEIGAWCEFFAKKITREAYRLQSLSSEPRLAEEWLREVEETPGALGKLWFAVSLWLSAVRANSWRLSPRPPAKNVPFRWPKPLRFAGMIAGGIGGLLLGSLALVIVAAPFVMVFLILRMVYLDFGLLGFAAPVLAGALFVYGGRYYQSLPNRNVRVSARGRY